MIVRDIVKMKGSTVFSTAPGGSVADALSLMVKNDIGSLVVLEGARLAGMLTFREILKALDARKGDLAGLKVADVMTANPVCGNPDDSLESLREIMNKGHIRYLPVKEGDRLLGVISFHDVANAVIERNARMQAQLVSDLLEPAWEEIVTRLAPPGEAAVVQVLSPQEMAPPLEDFGQVDQVATIISIAVVRELGPLISAIVLTGFAGASIAAELGTMVVGEEIEALEAHALDPVRFLVVPRVVATTISLVLLTVIADVTAVFAAGWLAVGFLGVPYELYKTNTLNQLVLSDFLTGLFKAGVFGMILSGIACYNGLKVTGGAAGVGRATTDTVVQTVVAVIIADLLFTGVFYQLGGT